MNNARFVLFIDAYSLYRHTTCHSRTLDLNDMVFVDTYYFNKIKNLVFNSTVGVFVGCTEVGERMAENMNNNIVYITYLRNIGTAFCSEAAHLYQIYGMDVTCK